MIMPTHIVAVAGITENDHGQILMVKTHRGHWVFPGGQVENGETLPQALIREINEESGIDVEVDKLIGVYSNTCSYLGYKGVEMVPTKVMMDFTCKLIGGHLRTSEETPESKWIPKDQVLDYMDNPNIIERFKAYLDFTGTVQYMSYETKPEYKLNVKRNI